MVSGAGFPREQDAEGKFPVVAGKTTRSFAQQLWDFVFGHRRICNLACYVGTSLAFVRFIQNIRRLIFDRLLYRS